MFVNLKTSDFREALDAQGNQSGMRWPSISQNSDRDVAIGRITEALWGHVAGEPAPAGALLGALCGRWTSSS